MPPAAISRSSTYFPKICGNIAKSHRSALCGLVLTAVACSDHAPAVTTVSVDAHQLLGCPVPDRGPSTGSPLELTLTPLGPFPASTFDVEGPLGLEEAGQELAFDPATVGVDALASDGSANSGGAFIGHTERRVDDRIDVLLWPEQTACPILAPDAGYPGTDAGQALGFSAATAVALVAGEDAEDRRAGSAGEFDTETGAAGVVPRESGALHVSRAFATVTEFGDGLLVAGGTNPFASAAAEDASGSAEVYRPHAGGFDPNLVELWSRRTHHAAVTLPATGETLLAGGLAPDSASNGPGQLLRQLEAISPSTLSSSISGLAALDLGRVDPVTLVLENGLIFVGGGYNVGSDPEAPRGDPIGELEWFLPDATRRVFFADLPTRPDRAFMALPGGGVLSVASCSAESAQQRADCSCVAENGGACEVNGDDQGWLDAWWIDPDGTPTPVPFAPANVLTPCPTPLRPLLVAGSDGAPWLVSTRDDGTPACLWRFEAWPEDPGGPPADAASHPRFLMTTLALDPSPDARVQPLSYAPDALVWVGPNGGLYGARLGQRGPLTRDASLLARGDAPFRPAHLVPDRDPSASTSLDGKPPVIFNHEFNGVLELGPTSPVVTLWAADTTYDSVSLTLEIEAPSDGSSPALPAVTFGSARGASAVCAWSATATPLPAPVTLTATRHGTHVTLSAPGLADTTCDVPDGPLALGVRAGSARTTLGKFDVTRLLLE
jgi:hypothetical protein